MMQLENISASLAELTALNKKGVEALFAAEQELAEAEHELDLVESRAFLSADGSVAERQAKAKLEAAEARLARDLARAGVGRIKMKLRGIESEIMSLATMAKIAQAEMKL
jgi:NADPH-dependent 7-cyano-7-deazaguanine reductase QueF-like protein